MSDRTYYVVVDKDGDPRWVQHGDKCCEAIVEGFDAGVPNGAPHKIIECITKSEYDALKAELERLSQYVGMEAARTFTYDELEEYVGSMPRNEIWPSDLDDLLNHFEQKANSND